MKTALLKFCRTLCLLLTFALPGMTARATHLAGADMTFECLNACTVRVHMKGYRDCSGVTGMNTQVAAALVSGGGPASLVPIFTSVQTIYGPVNAICPGVTSSCSGLPAPATEGIEVYEWYADFNVCPGIGSEYAFSWGECCRNTRVSTLDMPVNQGMYISLLYSPQAGCNESPVFSAIPVYEGCAGMAQQYYLGGTDPDGDSLVYSMGPLYTVNGVQVIYQPGFSASQPLGTSWTLNLDGSTGMLDIQPGPGNILCGVVGVYVDEYRNGVRIGTYERDVQILLRNCAGNQFPVFTGIQSDPGYCATISNDTVYTCGLNPIQVQVSGMDPDAGQSVRMYWDQQVPGLDFYNPAAPAQVDTVQNDTAMISFTPPAAGVYSLLVTLEDDACPLRARVQKRITIVAGSGNYLSVTTAQTGCNTLLFQAGGNLPVGTLITWTGTGGLTGSGNPLTWTYPGPGTYTWTCTATQGSFSGVVNGSITLSGYGSVITGPSPATICPGGTAVLAASGTWSSYQWSTGETTPGIIARTDGLYSITVTDAQGCTVQDTFTLSPQFPRPASILPPDFSIPGCPGSPVLVTAAAGYNLYEWSTGNYGQSLSLLGGGWYGIQAQDAQHCYWTDSIFVTRTLVPDVAGFVTTNQYAPLISQKVYIAVPNAANATVQLVDSTLTDSTGYYEFCTVTEPSFYLWAAPSAAQYPFDMPTYAYNGLVIFDGIQFTQGMIPIRQDWPMLMALQQSGGGVIGGQVMRQATQTPMAGLRLWLTDASFQPVGYRYTDAAGYFSFTGLNLGDYHLIADAPNVDPLYQTPLISLNATTAAYPDTRLLLHDTWLELLTLVQQDAPAALQVQLHPNPSTGAAALYLNLPVATDLDFRLTDALGRAVITPYALHLQAGQHQLPLDMLETLPAGIYLYSLRAGAQQVSGKWVKR